MWAAYQDARATAGSVPKEKSSAPSFVPTGLSIGGPAETYGTLLAAVLAAHKAPDAPRLWTVLGGMILRFFCNAFFAVLVLISSIKMLSFKTFFL